MKGHRLSLAFPHLAMSTTFGKAAACRRRPAHFLGVGLCVGFLVGRLVGLLRTAAAVCSGLWVGLCVGLWVGLWVGFLVGFGAGAGTAFVSVTVTRWPCGAKPTTAPLALRWMTTPSTYRPWKRNAGLVGCDVGAVGGPTARHQGAHVQKRAGPHMCLLRGPHRS